jgi:hypothetical protein
MSNEINHATSVNPLLFRSATSVRADEITAHDGGAIAAAFRQAGNQGHVAEVRAERSAPKGEHSIA